MIPKIIRTFMFGVIKRNPDGTVKGLKESDDETLEDVFIRLVGHSIEEAERISDEGSSEEE